MNIDIYAEKLKILIHLYMNANFSEEIQGILSSVVILSSINFPFLG